MRALILSFLFSFWGVCLVGILDSTMLFFLPLTVDVGIVVLVSRKPELFWCYPIVVAAVSLIGAALTFYMGRRLGETGLDGFMAKRRLERVRKRIKNKGAVAVALLDLIPPPFPFTAFILVGGALKVDTVRFFVAMFVVRLVRFGVEALLAVRYGQQIIGWLDSDLFRDIAYFFIVVLSVASVITLYQLIGKIRPRKQGAGKLPRKTRSPRKASGTPRLGTKT